VDAFQHLSEDHRAVERLFEKIEKADSRRAEHREQLFQRLREGLELHAQIEEKIFYPEMKKYTGTNELVGEALEEHGEVKLMLQEIGHLSAEDDQWSEMVNELKLAIQHHVREEENQLFPAAREEIDKSRLDELGAQIREMKRTAIA
jgi:hemerythrin-like domain-containing protein